MADSDALLWLQGSNDLVLNNLHKVNTESMNTFSYVLLGCYINITMFHLQLNNLRQNQPELCVAVSTRLI